MNKTLPLEEQLCFALYSASNAVVRLYRPLLQPFDLTYPQYVVLLALWQQDDISLGELGSKTLFDSGTLTPLVKKLEAEANEERFGDLAHILFDQANLAEGAHLQDPAAYVQRLNKLLVELSA